MVVNSKKKVQLKVPNAFTVECHTKTAELGHTAVGPFPVTPERT